MTRQTNRRNAGIGRKDGAPTRSVTIRDVALAASVGVGTVSNVLNRPNVVADSTKQRVLEAIESLGFVRHAGAALMRGGRAHTIGLVALDVHNPFFTELARGVESAIRQAGHLLILCNSDEDTEQERRYLEVLEEQRVLGVLISPVDSRETALGWLRDRGTAVVLLEDQRRDYCSVRVDNVHGGELATEHLLALGHRRLAVVTASLSIRQYRERLAGVHKALKSAGLTPEDSPVLELGQLPTATEIRAAGAELRSQHPDVTGIICGNDLIALGLIAGLVSQRVRVPNDISIVGYDDIDLAQQSPLPLTTVRQPRDELGRTGAQLLLDEALRDREHAHQQVVFQPELIVRETTGPPRTKVKRR